MKPVLQSMVLADRVYRDQETGKHIICGTFNKVLFKHSVEHPTVEVGGVEKKVIRGGMQAGSPWIYLSLTDIHGEVPMSFRFVDLAEDKVLFSAEFVVKSENPLDTLEAALPFPSLPTPHAGTFALELLCSNEPLGSLRILLEEMP